MSTRALTGRSAKILSRFPAFIRTEQAGKVLTDVAAALGKDLDEAERLLFGIQRAHRVAVVEEERDLFQLVALLGLQRADFVVLRRLYERGFFHAQMQEPADDRAKETQAYALYLDAFKQAVLRIVAVMLEGCGTIWALLEGAAILLGAETIVEPGTERVEHPDAQLPHGGFLHRTRVKYRLIEDEQIVTKTGFIYLLENPIVDKTNEDKERRQRERFRVKRGGFFHGPAAVQVTGVADRTVLPLVINLSTHEGVGFRRALAEGERLLFALDGRAYLDGVEVTADCYFFRGALADGSPFDEIKTEDTFVTVQPAGALDRNYPRPVLSPVEQLPALTLRLGESDWRFSVQEGAFDASGFAEAVFALPDDTTALNALPPSGKVQVRWREHEPFAVSLLLPADLQSLSEALFDGQDLRKLVRAGLERFRAAGIRIDVNYFDEHWVLDHSILRDFAAQTGEGIDFNGTIPTPSPT